MKFYYEGYYESSYQQSFEQNILYIYTNDKVYNFNMKDIVRDILINNTGLDEYQKFNEWNFDDILFDLEIEEDKQNFENLIYGESDEQGFIINKSNVEEINEDQAIDLIKSHLIIEMLKNDECKVKDFKKFLGNDFVRKMEELIRYNRQGYEFLV